MRAKQVGAGLLVGGIVGLGMLGKLIQRRHETNGHAGSLTREGSVVMTYEQADAFVTGLEAAKPPTGDEQIRRQRELYSKAAKLVRPARVRAAR